MTGPDPAYPSDPTRREPGVPDAGPPAPGWNTSQPAYGAGGYPAQPPGPGAPQPAYGGGYQQQPPPSGPPRPAVIPGRLWAGGVATAVVAALVAIVGILVARGVLDLPILAPAESGTWGDSSTLTYALIAFAGGLLATGLMHALLLSTPSPFTFFNWIMALATLVAAVLPFTTSADLDAKIATAIINALIGIAIWTLTDSTAARSLVRPRIR